MTTTTQAQAVRGLCTSEQDKTGIKATSSASEAIYCAATSKADALSLKLHNLTEIVKLAAFAAEARRTLSAIHDELRYRPELQAVITDGVIYSSSWSDMADNTGDVLHYVSSELVDLNGEFTGAVYGLARAAQEGGAA